MFSLSRNLPIGALDGATKVVPSFNRPLSVNPSIERKGEEGTVYECGVLEDYSSKYLLLREVHIKEAILLEKITDHKQEKRFGFDILYSRTIAIIRHTIDDPSC